MPTLNYSFFSDDLPSTKYSESTEQFSSVSYVLPNSINIDLNSSSVAIEKSIKTMLNNIRNVEEAMDDYRNGKYITWVEFVEKNDKGK